MASSVIRNCGRKPVLVISARYFSLSPSLSFDQDWRYGNGMPRNPNAYGPLTDKRDFSFLDGRAVPMGSGQVKRALKQKNYAEKIFQIVKEMDFAVYRNQRIQQETEDRNQAILKSKFKAKGHLVVNPSDNKSSL